MKKFKHFAFILMSALCIFATFTFGGCKKDTNYYIENSFIYNFDNSTYYTMYIVTGEFKIFVPEKGNYKIEYTLTTYGSDGTQAATATRNLTTVDGGEQTITFSITFDRQNDKNNSTAELSDVIITRTKVEGDYTPYAIGFGTTAGVILIGAVVVFVLDKTGVFKKRK